MGDQKFSCGRYKNRTFKEIAKSDADFCEAVLKTAVCHKYYPQDFKTYLLSLRRPSKISENNVNSFVKKWNENQKAEFRQILGSPQIDLRQAHPQAAGYPNGNLGVFIRYFIKKCIFNTQAANATSYIVESFASIFPFKVSKTVPSVRLVVRELFDDEFYASVSAFLGHHFADKCDLADDIVDLFLRNIYDFRKRHFDEYAVRRLKNVVNDAVDPAKSLFTTIYANDYLRQFPRLSQAGVQRYTQLRQMYNHLCAAFGREELGDQRRRHIRMLPEINCHELLSLLEPDEYAEQRAEYRERFTKYLFFFVYAVESPDHPVFFIDEPLYECLKGYVEYRCSREPPENLKLCIWLTTLVHRRSQPLNLRSHSDQFDVDDLNLQHVRDYVENFPYVESAVVDFVLPTSLIRLGIPIVTRDDVLVVYYTKYQKSDMSDFFEGLVRAFMCPLTIKRVTIYNAYTGVETSMLVPAAKKAALEFVRRHNNYDPAQPIPVEYYFTENLEEFFETHTIQWDDKYPKKCNPLPVYDYSDVFGDA